jgi:hypothetical protein
MDSEERRLQEGFWTVVGCTVVLFFLGVWSKVEGETNPKVNSLLLACGLLGLGFAALSWARPELVRGVRKEFFVMHAILGVACLMLVDYAGLQGTGLVLPGTMVVALVATLVRSRKH